MVSVNLFLSWLYLHDTVQLLISWTYGQSIVPIHVPDSTSWRAELFVKQKNAGGKPFEILRYLESPAWRTLPHLGNSIVKIAVEESVDRSKKGYQEKIDLTWLPNICCVCWQWIHAGGACHGCVFLKICRQKPINKRTKYYCILKFSRVVLTPTGLPFQKIRFNSFGNHSSKMATILLLSEGSLYFFKKVQGTLLEDRVSTVNQPPK